jgi:asparagine synthase (glutamine-hydrolysing)
MCGIAGEFDLKYRPIDPDRTRDMCALIRHRGPDDEGYWNARSVALGHRRLSIIDLSERGRNPLPNEDQSVWIVFNGEIYNYRELRAELLEKGHRFRTQTDTEVIVHLYEEYGVECVKRLNGMFAFAILDQRGEQGKERPRLLLARDRFGVKPLYYTILNDTLAFASEIKAFTALPEFTARPSPQALAEHFTFQNTFGDRTFFEGVKLLPAGHTLMCEGGRVTSQQYWDLCFEPRNDVSAAEFAGGLRERFEAAVTRQLMSDVPLGSYLSGGMDTGSITAVAARNINSMHTFTCGFHLPEGASELEKYFDESRESHDLAALMKTEHHELKLGPDAMAPVLPKVVWHLDEPRVGISYQVYYTAEMIRKFVTVVLSGVGGDELFAGYPWRYNQILESRNGTFESDYYRIWIRFLTDDEKRELFTPEMNRALGDFSTFDSFREAARGYQSDDPLHRALYIDFKTFLNGLLVVDDKLSMAHSIEARVPFLDNDLVDYVSRIPSQLKLHEGESKHVLRLAMRGLLPSSTIDRRKQGFTPPDETWYRENSLAFVEDLILGPRAVERGYFQPKMLRRLLDDHVAGKRNHRFLIWSLMCFEWWNRLFVDRETIAQ